jgi:hypothetical protein
MSEPSRDELPTEELRTAELNWISAERTRRRRRSPARRVPRVQPAGPDGPPAAIRRRTRFQLRGR